MRFSNTIPWVLHLKLFLSDLQSATWEDFILGRRLRWFPLDSAAKIYPLSMTHGRMAVFRLSAYLKEEVIPELLQMALTFTIKRFPSFATTIKKGFFWHYLDTSKRRYSLEAETSVPCRPLKLPEAERSLSGQSITKNASASNFFISLQMDMAVWCS